MKKLFYGVMAGAGCVLLAGVSAAETSPVRGYDKSEATELAPHVRTSPELSKQHKWSMERHANPHVGKEETKNLLRAKRPK